MRKQHLLEGCSEADFQAAGTKQYLNTCRAHSVERSQPVAYSGVAMTLATKTEFSKTELGFGYSSVCFARYVPVMYPTVAPTRVSEGKCLFPASRTRLTPVANP